MNKKTYLYQVTMNIGDYLDYTLNIVSSCVERAIYHAKHCKQYKDVPSEDIVITECKLLVNSEIDMFDI